MLARFPTLLFAFDAARKLATAAMGDSEWLLNPVATLCPVLRVRPALPRRRRTAGCAAGDARAQPTLEAAAAPSRVPRRSGGCWLCVCVCHCVCGCVKSNTVIYNRCIESPKIRTLTGLTGLDFRA